MHVVECAFVSGGGALGSGIRPRCRNEVLPEWAGGNVFLDLFVNDGDWPHPSC